jgi:hypothetical protein
MFDLRFGVRVGRVLVNTFKAKLDAWHATGTLSIALLCMIRVWSCFFDILQTLVFRVRQELHANAVLRRLNDA